MLAVPCTDLAHDLAAAWQPLQNLGGINQRSLPTLSTRHLFNAHCWRAVLNLEPYVPAAASDGQCGPQWHRRNRCRLGLKSTLSQRVSAAKRNRGWIFFLGRGLRTATEPCQFSSNTFGGALRTLYFTEKCIHERRGAPSVAGQGRVLSRNDTRVLEVPRWIQSQRRRSMHSPMHEKPRLSSPLATWGT